MITFSQDQLLDAFGKLPEPVRAYLLSNQYNTDIEAIGSQFKLRVDTIGALSQATSYMLCGLVTPTEILGELVARDTDAQTAKAVISELNTKIFKPLQDRIKNAPAADAEASEVEPAPQAAAPAPTPAPAPRAPQPVIPPPAVTMAPPPAPVQPAVPPPAPRSVPPPAPRPAMPTQPAAAPRPTYQPPAPAPRPSPEPPANLPGAMPAAPVPAPTPKIPSTNTNKEALHDVLKSYGVDPYREEPE